MNASTMKAVREALDNCRHGIICPAAYPPTGDGICTCGKDAALRLLDTEASQQEPQECLIIGNGHTGGWDCACLSSQQDREAAHIVTDNSAVIAALTKERDTLTLELAKGQRDRMAVDQFRRQAEARAEELKKRLPICPPCEIGEDGPCICEEPLVPKVYLDETTERALAAEHREAKLVEALEKISVGCQEGTDDGICATGCAVCIARDALEEWGK